MTSADTTISMSPATPETEMRSGDSCPAICSASRSNLCGDSSNAELPLFQGDDGGSHPTSPLQFLIRPISNETAENWVVKWHYSHRIPTGKNICFGLYASNELYAVIVYGIGVNPYQAKFLGVERVLEIKRMCRREPPLPQYPLSRFIALTAKMAAKEYPYDCLIAFADPEQGHEGTVYKASGFKMHGMTNAEWHLEDENGDKRHRRFAFRHARRNGQTLAESRDELKLKRVQTKPKYRWIRMARVTPNESSSPTAAGR